MPVLLEEKRIFFSSAEKEASEIAVVERNCSIGYCFDGRPGATAKNGADAARARPASPKRRRTSWLAPFLQGDSIRRRPVRPGPGTVPDVSDSTRFDSANVRVGDDAGEGRLYRKAIAQFHAAVPVSRRPSSSRITTAKTT